VTETSHKMWVQDPPSSNELNSPLILLGVDVIGDGDEVDLKSFDPSRDRSDAGIHGGSRWTTRGSIGGGKGCCDVRGRKEPC
jgi:hypothetical protein